MRHKLITIIISIFLGGSIPLFAQVAGCEVNNVPFFSGERVTYRAVYNWGFIWVNAGDVVFTVSDTIYNSQSAWHLKSEGWTLKQYDWFYKVRDRFESIVYKEGYKPVWFERDTHEGSYESYNHYQFRYPTEEIELSAVHPTGLINRKFCLSNHALSIYLAPFTTAAVSTSQSTALARKFR